jgi:adenylylsulfate kinase-like enzyme
MCAMSDPRPLENRAGVIWVSGFSASGKTTVGRKVNFILNSLGARTVFLDGDDLRSIFGARWGYTRDDRVHLAHVYFRLCSHLASQGYTVTISAVAMYDEIREWMRTNIPNCLEVFLDVPEDERRRRDAATKKLYDKIGDLSKMYDEPKFPSLRIENYGANMPDDVANEIVEFYRRSGLSEADMGKQSHWNDYYSKSRAPTNPSPFGTAVTDRLAGRRAILEVGCGNGRDAAHFASLGYNVTAIDVAAAAIEQCRRLHAELPATFIETSLPAISSDYANSFDVVYSRFVLHAMTLDEETDLLKGAAQVLVEDGLLFIECRSLKDPMARMGEVISPTERIHGHYRRFIDVDELSARVESYGFSILDSIESAGLAVHGDEDPVVIRLTARKN